MHSHVCILHVDTEPMTAWWSSGLHCHLMARSFWVQLLGRLLSVCSFQLLPISEWVSFHHQKWCIVCIVHFLSMPLINAVTKQWCGPQRCKVAVPPYKRMGLLTNCMLYMWNKFLYFYRMKNRICTLKSLGQINSCNWLDCIMPVDGDKSKYGTFLFYDCKSWQVISPILLHSAGLGSVVIHLRTGTKQKKFLII